MANNIVIKGQVETAKQEYLSDDDIDKIIRFLRSIGYRYGVIKGSNVCKVALYNKDEGMQILFQRDGIHLLLLKELKKYKVLYGKGMSFDPANGQLTIDLTDAQEIQL